MDTRSLFSSGFDQIVFRFAAIALAASVSGCATTYQISAGQEDPASAFPEESEIRFNLWGANVDPQTLEADCMEQGGAGLNHVVIEETFKSELISILTLGLKKKVTVRYSCDAN